MAVLLEMAKYGLRALQPPAAQGRARTDPMAEPFGAKGLIRKYAANNRYAIQLLAGAGEAGLVGEGSWTGRAGDRAVTFSPGRQRAARPAALTLLESGGSYRNFFGARPNGDRRHAT